VGAANAGGVGRQSATFQLTEIKKMNLYSFPKPINRLRLASILAIAALLIFGLLFVLGMNRSYWFYQFSPAILLIPLTVPFIFKALIDELTNRGDSQRVFAILMAFALVMLLSCTTLSILSNKRDLTNKVWFNGYLFYGTRTLKPLEQRGFRLYKCYGYGLYCEESIVGAVKDPSRDVSLNLEVDEATNSLGFLVNGKVIYSLDEDNDTNNAP
jgi:hypothetical protein